MTGRARYCEHQDRMDSRPPLFARCAHCGHRAGEPLVDYRAVMDWGKPSLLSDKALDEIKSSEGISPVAVENLVRSVEIVTAERDRALDILRVLAAEAPAAKEHRYDDGGAVGRCIHCDEPGVEYEPDDGWLIGVHAEHCVWRRAVELTGVDQ